MLQFHMTGAQLVNVCVVFFKHRETSQLALTAIICQRFVYKLLFTPVTIPPVIQPQLKS